MVTENRLGLTKKISDSIQKEMDAKAAAYRVDRAHDFDVRTHDEQARQDREDLSRTKPRRGAFHHRKSLIPPGL